MYRKELGGGILPRFISGVLSRERNKRSRRATPTTGNRYLGAAEIKLDRCSVSKSMIPGRRNLPERHRSSRQRATRCALSGRGTCFLRRKVNHKESSNRLENTHWPVGRLSGMVKLMPGKSVEGHQMRLRRLRTECVH